MKNLIKRLFKKNNTPTNLKEKITYVINSDRKESQSLP